MGDVHLDRVRRVSVCDRQCCGIHQLAGGSVFRRSIFVAALVFGAASYQLQRGTAKILARIVSGPTAGTVTVIKSIGMALFAVETVVIFFVARWVVVDLLFG